MNASPLSSSVETKVYCPRTASHTVRVLIQISGGSALLTARARMVITSGSGAPFAEVVLKWESDDDEETALRAVLEALKMARRYRAQRVVIYIDNELAASIAMAQEKAPSALIGLALQVRALAHTFRAVEVRHGMSVVAPTLPDLDGRAARCGDREYPGDSARDMGEDARQWTS
ncbi:MAG: hypothetical protein ACM3ZU_00665 [Bacteroidota bacterium]